MAAQVAPLVPIYVLSQNEFGLLHGSKEPVRTARYKCFVNTGDVKREIWFQSKEQALRFRDALTEMQFGTWNFEVKEEINIWKNM